MKLTWKQQKIVCLMPFLTNREIGEALGGTGRNQMKNQCTEIYKKLRVPDYPNNQDKRIAAVVYALRDGEITFSFFVGIAAKYTTRGGE
jgi:DNA-binding NarL/FixJ family response regulator